MQRRSFLGGIFAGLAALCGVKPVAAKPNVAFGMWIESTSESLKFVTVGPSKRHSGWWLASAQQKNGHQWRACYRPVEGGVDVLWMRSGECISVCVEDDNDYSAAIANIPHNADPSTVANLARCQNKYLLRGYLEACRRES